MYSNLITIAHYQKGDVVGSLASLLGDSLFHGGSGSCTSTSWWVTPMSRPASSCIPGKLDLLPICRGTQRKVMSLTFLSLSISRPAPLLSRSQQPLWHHGDPGRLHALQHIGDSVPTRLLALHLLGYLWKMILRNALWSSTLAGWPCLTMFDIDIWAAGKIIC